VAGRSVSRSSASSVYGFCGTPTAERCLCGICVLEMSLLIAVHTAWINSFGTPSDVANHYGDKY
jgi:hypothetical protein